AGPGRDWRGLQRNRGAIEPPRGTNRLRPRSALAAQARVRARCAPRRNRDSVAAPNEAKRRLEPRLLSAITQHPARRTARRFSGPGEWPRAAPQRRRSTMLTQKRKQPSEKRKKLLNDALKLFCS